MNNKCNCGTELIFDEMISVLDKYDDKLLVCNKYYCPECFDEYEINEEIKNEEIEKEDEKIKEELEYICIRKPLKDSILRECNEIISFEDFFTNENYSRYRILFEINNLKYRLYEAYQFPFNNSIDVKFVELDADIIKCIKNI